MCDTNFQETIYLKSFVYCILAKSMKDLTSICRLITCSGCIYMLDIENKSDFHNYTTEISKINL